MAKEKALSICIPTYNRAKALDATLDNLEKEIEPVRDDIEICISDNCAPDSTPQVVEKWKKRLPIIYARNEQNMGYDINVARVAKLASARYIWFIGDDDDMVKGTVKRLVNGIRANWDKKIGAIFLNQLEKNNVITHFGFSDFRVFRKEDLAFPLNLGFAGSICVNNKIAQGIIGKTREGDSKLLKEGYDEPILHGFAHAYFFLECLKEGEYVGIEPVYGMKFMASGEKTTYEKKIFLELIMAKYYLEIRMYYPWFMDSQIYNPKGYWKKFFSVGAVAAEKPDLEQAYKTLFRLYLRILETEGRGTEILLSKMFERLRGFGLWRFFLIRLHNRVRKAKGLELDRQDDRIKDIDKNLRYIVASVDKMLKTPISS
jgi:glycosyltransferase involved in cell wall biosynthesis